VIAQITFTNKGTTTCRLGGYPTLVATPASPGKSVLTANDGAASFGGLVPADLAPGRGGELLFGSGPSCGNLNTQNGAVIEAIKAASRYKGVTINLPNGGGEFALPDATVDAPCGLFESPLGISPAAAP
jgi:hypothetical protein